MILAPNVFRNSDEYSVSGWLTRFTAGFGHGTLFQRGPELSIFDWRSWSGSNRSWAEIVSTAGCGGSPPRPEDGRLVLEIEL